MATGNYVITIARGFGSGGRQIAMDLGAQLGIPCYESQILTMASDLSGLNRGLFLEVDEKLRGNFLVQKLKKSPSSDEVLLPMDKDFVSDVNLYNIQAQVIRELAHSESCIIVGKCANHILEGFRNVVSVYIEAPREFCLRTVMERLGVDELEAQRLIETTDRYRADYYRFYTGGKSWTDPIAYDLTLNRGRVGAGTCVALIKALVELKFAN